MVVVAVGCTGNPTLDIISPVAGGQVAGSPVVLTVVGHDLLGFGGVDVSSDGMAVTGRISSSHYGECDRCEFTISFAGATIPNGSHLIEVDLDYDLTVMASDSINLEFAR